MADILIKNMEMPQTSAERCIVIHGDGRITTFVGTPIDYAKAIPITDHGRLIDADEKIDQLKKLMEQAPRPFQEVLYQYTIDLLGRCPTIVPAELSKEEA